MIHGVQSTSYWCLIIFVNVVRRWKSVNWGSQVIVCRVLFTVYFNIKENDECLYIIKLPHCDS